MSFFSEGRSDRSPGPISGNPLNGICERVCISVKKIFDACIKQIEEKNLIITVTNIVEDPPVEPFTYVSATSSDTTAVLQDLNVERFVDRPNFARVTATVIIPIEVIFTDANGVEFSGTSEVHENIDIVMFVPQASIIPYEIVAFCNLISTEGVYLGNNQFSINCCITIIIKVVADVNLLVPSYGYAIIPPAQDYTQDVCPGFFDLPLYPAATTPNPNT